MPAGDIHFAAVWPTANHGAARKAIVPLQCSFAEASKTLACLLSAWDPRQHKSTPRAVETSALGSFCLFTASASTPSALIVVGTKSWSCTRSVFALLRRVQIELARDDSSCAMPPRLFERKNWDDDDESESWEDEYMWSEISDDDGLAREPATPDGVNGTPTREVAEPKRSDKTPTALALRVDPPEKPTIPKGEKEQQDQSAKGMGAHAMNDPPFFETNFHKIPPKAPQKPPAMTTPLGAYREGKAAVPVVITGVSAAAIDQGMTFLAGSGSGDRPMIATQAAAPVTAMAQQPSGVPSGVPSISAEELSSSDLVVVSRPPDGTGSQTNVLGGGGGVLQQPAAAMDLSVLLAPAEDGPLGGVGGAERSGPADPPLHSSEGDGVLAPAPAPVSDAPTLAAPAAEGEAGVYAAAKPNDADAAGTAAGTAMVAGGSSSSSSSSSSSPPADSAGDPAGAAGPNVAAAVSAAVSEDLAYVHRGAVLQSYAITGSVLVAASHGSRPRLRITDRKGHIATATANAAVAEENTAGSTPPTREYSCKEGGVQPGGAAPKFLPTLMYRCSPAVKVLPVRVTCRLRAAGKSSVIVWAQVIVNPQVPQSLSGVSVLVNLPFLPLRNDQGDVKAEPPATLKADGKILEWVLPSDLKRGAKQTMQARLSVDEGEVRVATIPQTAPAMARCHLLDSMFSSVEIDAAALGGEGAEAAPGRVMKRCRVQCTQQG